MHISIPSLNAWSNSEFDSFADCVIHGKSDHATDDAPMASPTALPSGESDRVTDHVAHGESNCITDNSPTSAVPSVYSTAPLPPSPVV